MVCGKSLDRNFCIYGRVAICVEKGGAVARMGDARGAYRILVRKSGGKRQLVKPRWG